MFINCVFLDHKFFCRVLDCCFNLRQSWPLHHMVSKRSFDTNIGAPKSLRFATSTRSNHIQIFEVSGRRVFDKHWLWTSSDNQQFVLPSRMSMKVFVEKNNNLETTPLWTDGWTTKENICNGIRPHAYLQNWTMEKMTPTLNNEHAGDYGRRSWILLR